MTENTGNYVLSLDNIIIYAIYSLG